MGRLVLQAPQVQSVSQFRFTVVHPQVDRQRCLAFDDDGVKSGGLQFCAPKATHVRFAHGAGERRPGANGVAPAASQRRASKRPAGKDQPIFRPQRVGARRHLFQQIVGDESCTAQVTAVKNVVGRLDSDLPIGQVDAQNASVVSKRH